MVGGRRLAAHLVDGVIYGIICFVVLIPAALISGTLLIVALVASLFGQIAYYPLWQRRDGRTPGKRNMGIKVVDAQGNTPSTGALVTRSVPLVFELFYLIPLFSMLASPYNQRLGDRLAGTFVIGDREAG